MNRYLHFLCYVSYICLLVACIACGFDWECAHQKKHQLCRLGGQPWCLSLPAGGEGSGWAEEGEGWNGRENSPYTQLHFYTPPFCPVMRAILLSATSVQLNMQILVFFCSLSSKAEITPFLQAEQIVAKLMMNMAAADKRLAEEQNRQAMVITM